MKKRIYISIFCCTLAVLIFYFISIFFAKAFLSPNNVTIGNPPEFLHTENINFKTEDGKTIKGWYSKTSDSAKVIILLHGYKANRLEMLPKADLFKEMGYDVLLYDARACGESEGEIVSLGYYEKKDLISAVKYLKGIGKKEIAVYGFSQGGATAIMAASGLSDLKCIISEATFDNLENAIDNRFRKYLFVPGYIGTIFMKPEAEKILGISIEKIQPVKEISKIKIPIFIIGAENDSRTLVENTMDLYNAANEPKELWIAPDSEHENIYSTNPEEYKIKVQGFLNKYF
ncbi:MAG: alpha/beta fold hydrolase [Ignavibacteriae bacterium]|nr:alpha/beta fold hydrolase [Ignavibacteriota bacterium]